MRAIDKLARCAGAIALITVTTGCPAPCNTFVDPNPLLDKHFENDPECVTDPLCGLQVVTGTARRTQTLVAGEHGLEITAGSEVAQSMSRLLPDGSGQDAGAFEAPRQEYIRMTVRCDQGASIRVEELISETLRATPIRPDSGVRDAGRVDARADVRTVDVAIANDARGSDDATADASTTDALESDAAIDDASDTDVAVADASESDAGEHDAAVEDASAPVDAVEADASFDAGTLPEADSGIPAADGGFSVPPPPRLRIGNAVIPASTRWARTTVTFTTQTLPPASVETASVVNLRFLVTGTGVCMIDDVQYGSIASGICGR